MSGVPQPPFATLVAALQAGSPSDEQVEKLAHWANDNGTSGAVIGDAFAAASAVIVSFCHELTKPVIKNAIELTRRCTQHMPSGDASATAVRESTLLLHVVVGLARSVALIDNKKPALLLESLKECDLEVSSAVAETIRRSGMRKNAINAKSFAPFQHAQVPDAMVAIHEAVDDFTQSTSGNCDTFVARLRDIWAEHRLHPVLAFTSIITALESLGLPGRFMRGLTADVGAAWCLLIPSPVTRELVATAAMTALKRCAATISPDSTVARLLCTAVRHHMLTVQQGYALYCDILAVDPGAAAAAAMKLKTITSDLHHYANAVKAEMILDMNRQLKSGMRDSQQINSARFFEITSALPEPSWGGYFADLGATSGTASYAPVAAPAYAVELIRSGAFAAAALFIEACAEQSLCLFIFPRSVREASVVTAIVEALESFWQRSDSIADNNGSTDDQLSYMAELFPLLVLAQSHLVQQPLLALSLGGFARQLASAAAAEALRATEGQQQHQRSVRWLQWAELAVAFLACVFFPCLRCLQGTPVMLHDSLVRLMTALGPEQCAKIILRADATSHPHDQVARTEAQALLTQGLRRVTKDTVKHYTLQLRQVVYTNPIMVVERLVAQAIGYSDSNLLVVHAQLIRHAPPSVLQLFTFAAVSSMLKYADEEREGAEARVAILGAFVAIVWRQNLSVYDPGYYIHTIERELAKDTRASTLFATEALQSLLLELLHQPLEVVEQFNEQQLAGLCAGQQTRWFVRGCAESFFASRWDDLFTPYTLSRTRASLRRALLADGVGGRIIVHLLRLQSTLYELYADLSGTMESILMLTADHYDKVTSLALVMNEIVANGEKASCRELMHMSLPAAAWRVPPATLHKVAHPVMAARMARPAPPLSLPSGGNLLDGYDVQRAVAQKALLMQHRYSSPEEPEAISLLRATFDTLGAFHLIFLPRVYDVANGEIDRFIKACDRHSRTTKVDKRSAAHLSQLKTSVEKEADVHQQVYRAATKFLKEHVIKSLVNSPSEAPLDPVAFVQEQLLPRALLSFEDALYVPAFIEMLLIEASAISNSCDPVVASPVERQCAQALQRTLVEVLLTFITAATTATASQTPAEAKRIGIALKNSVLVLRHALLPPSCVLSPACAALLRGKGDTLSGLPWPKELLRLEAYFSQVYVPLLLDSRNVPLFIQRNVLQQLERMKEVFPSHVRTVALIRQAVEAHNRPGSPLFAMASAISKGLDMLSKRLIAPGESTRGGRPSTEAACLDELLKPLDAAIAALKSHASLAPPGPEGQSCSDIEDEEEEGAFTDDVDIADTVDEGIGISGEEEPTLDAAETSEERCRENHSRSASSSRSREGSAAEDPATSGSDDDESEDQEPPRASRIKSDESSASDRDDGDDGLVLKRSRLEVDVVVEEDS